MRRVFLILLYAAFGATGAKAATDTTDVSSVRTLQDSIIVTANRFGLTPEKSVWPAVLIKQLDLRTAGSLELALDGEGGLDVRNQNGTGSLTTLSNWGVFNRHMLLLYDGRPVRDYSLGGFNLSDYSADELQRVEILKGPQSAFYGSDAVGGVINLISANTLVDRLEVATRQGNLGLNSYNMSIARRLGQIGVGGFAELTQADNSRDNAGSRRYLFTLRGDFFSPNSRHRISAAARYFNDSLGVPGPMPAENAVPAYGTQESYSAYDHQQDENYSGDLQYRYDHSKSGQLGLDFFWERKNLDYKSLYNYQYDYYTFDSSVTPVDSTVNHDSVDVYSQSLYHKRSSGMNIRYMNKVNAVTLSGGVDWLSGSIRSTSDDHSLATNTVGPFAPYEYSYDSYNFWKASQRQLDLWSNVIWEPAGRFAFDISGRAQMVTDRRTQPSYNLGLITTLAESMKLKIGYAYAFRLPSIAEQFAEDFFTAGNRQLNPEVSHSLIGTLDLSAWQGRGTVSLTVFHQYVDSLIQYQYQPSSYKYVPENVNQFHTTGMDVSLNYSVARELSIEWGGVFQRARQSTDAGQKFIAANYVPDLKWRLNLDGTHRNLSYRFGIDYTSQRSLLMGDYTKTISGVYELSANLSFKPTSSVTLSFTGSDLTNRRRPDQFGFDRFDHDYPSCGRQVTVSAGWKLF